jgi:drug/metabolite transporter (DMT)-like permease
LARAFGSADASFVIPFDYSQLVFGALMGFALFGEIPAWTTVAGSLLIVMAAFYIARREAQIARQAKARAA